MSKMKICVIGAGSPYTPEIVEKLSSMREALPIGEIMLMDINENRLDIMHSFCIRYAKHLGYDVKISKTSDRKKAIDGSTFINTQIRVGGNEARVRDERIPLSMGLVGQETTGAGGFAKGLRTIPAMLEIARDVERLAPDSWIINYTNPTGLVAEAVNNNTRAKIVGLCAGGMFAQNWVSKALGVRPDQVRYDFAGLNHMNFSYNITVNGRHLTDEEFAKAAACVGSVDAGLIIKLGALPSPYLQYYYHTAKKVEAMRSAGMTRGEEVMEIEKELYADFANPDNHTKPHSLVRRGGGGYSEIATAVMDAIYNNKDTWIVANVPSRGVLSFLPDNAVIETPCIANASGLTPLALAQPPKAVWGVIAAVKNYEQLAVEAAVTGNRDTAVLALVAHPLVNDFDKAEELLSKLLQANKQYLPQFFQET
jgi:6-phospho-beta-glucosidase